MACAPSEDSDQPAHPINLVRVFAVHMKKVWVERTAKTLIRLGGCPGWSESSMGAQSFCWFCHEAAQMTSRKVIWSTFNNICPDSSCEKESFEPSHESMVCFVLRKLILQTHTRRHPEGLDAWFWVGPFVYFHTWCVRTVRIRRLAWAFAGRLCDKYHDPMSWLIWLQWHLYMKAWLFWIANHPAFWKVSVITGNPVSY